MKKMKYPFGIILSFVLLFTGCKFDDGDIWKELEKHTERIAALEAWQQTVNTNINALQGLVSALENNDYVTGVIPVKEGSVEIGYTITFTKSPSITIYHGDKGDKGDSGATPEIGVGQDTDGKYYWMLNGEWLLDGADKIPSTGDKGDKDVR